MRVAAYIALVVGLAAAIALIAWRGIDTVAAVVAPLGAGILLLPLIYVPHIFGASTSWSLIFPAGQRPSFPVMLRTIWIGIAVETLLPLAGLAAEIVKARLMIRAGVRPIEAGSVALVDMTVQLVTLVVWGVIGVAALVDSGTQDTLFWPAVGGACFLGLFVVLFLLAQHAGLLGAFARRAARRLSSERWRGISDGVVEIERTIRSIYDRPWRILFAGTVRCCTRSVMAVELWVAAWMMGHPIAPGDALMFIGVVGTIRAIAFILPGGWGLQEASYMLLGQVVGVSPDVALALSLASRARELILGLPALLVWHFSESRGLKGLIAGKTSELDPA